jgi:hypothetical protein
VPPAQPLADGEIDVGLMDTTDAYLATKDLLLPAITSCPETAW